MCKWTSCYIYFIYVFIFVDTFGPWQILLFISQYRRAASATHSFPNIWTRCLFQRFLKPIIESKTILRALAENESFLIFFCNLFTVDWQALYGRKYRATPLTFEFRSMKSSTFPCSLPLKTIVKEWPDWIWVRYCNRKPPVQQVSS